MTDLTRFAPRPVPGTSVLDGVYIRCVPLDMGRHGPDLFAAICGPENDELWRFIPVGPFADLEIMKQTFAYTVQTRGWQSLALCDRDNGRPLGTASYMRLRPEHGSCEVGCVVFSQALQRTRAATEAIYLMARHVFDLGYRRFEWKCHNENEASKRAARRFGFHYEGLFRQDMVIKGENRDTAWFAMTDRDWVQNRMVFEAWLAPGNFTKDGRQKQSMEEIRAL